MTTIRFNQALFTAAKAAVSAKSTQRVRVIRDVFGRLRFAVDATHSEFPAAELERLSGVAGMLGAFASSGATLFRDDFSDPDAFFGSADWHETLVSGLATDEGREEEISVDLLDRQVIGQYWLQAPKLATEMDLSEKTTDAKLAPPRVVFYGIKGGVGRSTALALFAHRLASLGKRVLLLDFDLESPGLSSLLLPTDRGAECGLVDWFVEDAVGQGESVLPNLVVDSPLAEHTSGAIRIAGAMGLGEKAYLSKLSRVYADVPRSGVGAELFSERIHRLVEQLELQEQPDVVLIDSRAGLHDLAAISIAGLATLALLFATDTPQNWQGYEQLFAHWRSRPNVLRRVRERLALVQALFPESDQAARSASFREHAYDLFANNLYDQIAPGADTPIDAFTASPDSEDAPHFPMQIRWNARLQEFNPLLSYSKGGASEAEVNASFGPFFEEIIAAIF